MSSRAMDAKQFRQRMQELYQQEKGRKSILLEGDNLKVLLLDASLELGVPVKALSYEVFQKGRKAGLFTEARPWKLMIYEDSEYNLFFKTEIEKGTQEVHLEEKSDPIDGFFVFKKTAKGLLLKVTSAQNDGHTILLEEVRQEAIRRNFKCDTSLLQQAVTEAKGEYVYVGDILVDLQSFPRVNLSITSDEMEVYIQVLHIDLEESIDIMAEDIFKVLESNRIINKAILYDAIEAFIDHPEYNKLYLVAHGQAPMDGADARVEYKFTLDKSYALLEQDGGRVDYKAANESRNVHKGDIVAEKIPAQRGSNGYSVRGIILPARDGRDVPFKIGNNVSVSKDGNSVISDIDGYLDVRKDGSLQVNSLTVIATDVGALTGNIDVNGSLVIQGGVKSGYSVRASGSIEIHGLVEKATIEAQHNIHLSSGINGNLEGVIKSFEGDIWTRFVDNAHLYAGGKIRVIEGVVNSHIEAGEAIYCAAGRRSRVVGSTLIAGHLIELYDVGGQGGGQVSLEVGFDLRERHELEELREYLNEISSEYNSIARTLTGQGNQDLTAIEDSGKPRHEILKNEYVILRKEYESLKKEEIRRQSIVRSHFIEGAEVLVTNKLFPTVYLQIGFASQEIVRELSGCQFVQERDTILTKVYKSSSAGNAKKISDGRKKS